MSHSLTSAGADASEDGTGRGTPLVAAPLTKGSASGEGVNAPGRRQEDDVNIVAYPISGDALREGAAKTPSADAEGRIRLRDPGLGVGDDGEPAFTPTKAHPGAVAFALRRDPGGVGQGHNTNFIAGPLGGGNDGIGRRSEDDPNTVVQTGVRRLTPVECERLQGLPDGWTQLDAKTPDSRRYSALGDAVTASVSEWIGGRL